MNDSQSALVTDTLEPLFWQPARLGVDSAWLGHVPFGHWLVSVDRPASIVELGTRSGVSFSAFCEAAIRCRIDTRAWAFATQESAAAASRPEIAENAKATVELGRFLDQRYASVSTLQCSTPEGALQCVPDGRVDLLHINDVRESDIARLFADWYPKLSRRAIVLVHSTNKREDNHGIWRFWTEMSGRYPHFEFWHGEGLGILVVGEAAQGAVKALCGLHGDDAATVRHRFAVLGRPWVVQRQLDRENGALAARDDQIAAHALRTSAHATQSASLIAEIDRLRSCIEAAHGALDEFSQEITALEHERETFLKSTSWRITAPLRRLAGKADALQKRPSVVKPFVEISEKP